jgi:hypothetical protein
MANTITRHHQLSPSNTNTQYSPPIAVVILIWFLRLHLPAAVMCSYAAAIVCCHQCCCCHQMPPPPPPLNVIHIVHHCCCHRFDAATATTIVKLTIVYCQRKRQQQHHRQCIIGSTNVKTFTSPDTLDLFYLSTVFEVCDGSPGNLAIGKLLAKKNMSTIFAIYLDPTTAAQLTTITTIAATAIG